MIYSSSSPVVTTHHLHHPLLRERVRDRQTERDTDRESATTHVIRPVFEPGFRVMGHRFWPGRVGSCVGMTDPVFDPVL